MLGIIDYGMGNLFSVSKALERLDIPYFISEDKEKLMEADALILPGVGAFKDAMVKLNETGLSDMIREYAKSDKPLLGICLGMQLLFEESEEHGHAEGLHLLPGKIVRFPGESAEGVKYKVPHMGWNRLHFKKNSDATTGLEDDYVYFVHSYYAETDDEIIIASSEYDKEVPAVVGKGNVYGMQFHPEKSSKLGMELLSGFTKLIKKG
ncbi:MULTISPECIES: imidazole glycerol phosphate synthase subunit HisH [Bacillaceae]|uniref:imidazole glycerol phosphate synthase subunit HisH n=1 Tax=Bacillaceae TaxID=186817 RepID=UPI0017835191|nr:MULTISPECIES: imidazole glycerol phosphate synthase subunit HisH [Bacillaceae]MBE0317799.1 imidazole glycerol phosphate synthase subunit HisH [Xanthomonas citri pv. punicae]MBE0317811.1 imidazole glycerol phosphate synthase subunit HisH [Xanthomonas citri pv. punicae]MCE4050370.1 imidazole glycerol phosphate synthase subunit HisH [Bacillus sp. Au-Bac7]MCM3029606.1 imidazole glycerol phosphate synthase subunit HisH [Niallia sp. MER 6]MDL0437066.1 imidazole glycerol phosphate synthase subunit